MVENVAESGRKRSKVELAQLMVKADSLIISGATHTEAALQL